MIHQAFNISFWVPSGAEGINQQFVAQTILLWCLLLDPVLILIDFGLSQRVDITHVALIAATIIILISSILISTFGSFTRLRTILVYLKWQVRGTLPGLLHPVKV